jgi:hypothetical protein
MDTGTHARLADISSHDSIQSAHMSRDPTSTPLCSVLPADQSTVGELAPKKAA